MTGASKQDLARVVEVLHGVAQLHQLVGLRLRAIENRLQAIDGGDAAPEAARDALRIVSQMCAAGGSRLILEADDSGHVSVVR